MGGGAGKTLNDSSSGGATHPEVAGFSVVASEAEDLSGLFAVRPRGFGGADVMASLALPPRSAGSSSERPEETLWLLGGWVSGACGQAHLGYALEVLGPREGGLLGRGRVLSLTH